MTRRDRILDGLTILLLVGIVMSHTLAAMVLPALLMILLYEGWCRTFTRKS